LSLARKLKALSKELDKWSKKPFPNNIEEIDVLKGEIQHVLNAQNLNFARNKVKQLTEKIEQC